MFDSASTQSTFLFSTSVLTTADMAFCWSSIRPAGLTSDAGTVVVEILCRLVKEAVDEASSAEAEVESDVEDMEVVKVVVAEVAVEVAAAVSDDDNSVVSVWPFSATDFFLSAL